MKNKKAKQKTKTSIKKKAEPVIYAAGGLLIKEEDSVKKIAIVHRPKHKDWSIPKGKPKRDETLDKTAIREVGEETYIHGEIINFAGSITYKTKKAEKIVLFWNMQPVGSFNGKKAKKTEIDDIIWITPEKAIKKLTHRVEIEFIKSIFFKKKPYY